MVVRWEETLAPLVEIVVFPETSIKPTQALWYSVANTISLPKKKTQTSPNICCSKFEMHRANTPTLTSVKYPRFDKYYKPNQNNNQCWFPNAGVQLSYPGLSAAG